jgi:hypothetical protein
VVVIGLGKNLLFKSILAHCVPVGQSNFRNKIPNFIEQKNFAHFQGKNNKNNPWYLSCCYALDKKYIQLSLKKVIVSLPF